MENFSDEVFEVSGREYEINKMREFLEGDDSELISIIGRRRVGKTYLIKRIYSKEMAFHLTGIKEATKKEQLENFAITLSKTFKLATEIETPKSWRKAFEVLKLYIKKKKSTKKPVLFFDELPWLASPRSGFLSAFDYFWNTWAVDQRLVVVICGSAATWMIENIVNDKGGLHNRVTAKIHLEPFTLAETEQFFKDRKINLPRYEIISLYMALGGIPFYLRGVKKGESAAQAIDRLCFGKKALLYGEFENLYKALFTNYNDHIQVINALATKQKGLTRSEILAATKLNSGGSFSMVMRELEESSFISGYTPFQKKERDKLYRLTDEYSLFYLQFIEGQNVSTGSWLKKIKTPAINAWAGYAFESICFKHINSIKKSLGIEGLYTEESSYFYKKTEELPGFQIDLIVNRADNAINLCEAKFYNTEYIVTAEELQKMRLKKAYFHTATKSKKQLINTLITTYGLAPSQATDGIDKSLNMNALFNTPTSIS